MNMEVREPTPSDVLTLGALMRDADHEETVRAGFDSGIDALIESIKMSDLIYIAVVDDEPVAMWGLVLGPMMSLTGAAWLLTGTGIERYKMTFLKTARRVIAGFSERCPNGLFAFIDAEYDKAIRWAEWLGFEVSPPVPHPTTGKPFVGAVIRRM
jgi:hypothetical protein